MQLGDDERVREEAFIDTTKQSKLDEIVRQGAQKIVEGTTAAQVLTAWADVEDVLRTAFQDGSIDEGEFMEGINKLSLVAMETSRRLGKFVAGESSESSDSSESGLSGYEVFEIESLQDTKRAKRARELFIDGVIRMEKQILPAKIWDTMESVTTELEAYYDKSNHKLNDLGKLLYLLNQRVREALLKRIG